MSVQIFSPFLIGLFVSLLSCKRSLYSLLTSSLLNVHFVNICSHTFLLLKENKIFFFSFSFSKETPRESSLEEPAAVSSVVPGED